MAHLKLFVSNKLEKLSNALGELIISAPQNDPFESEIVLIQSRGMERWLSFEIAKHHGVCANIKFIFPNNLFDMIFQETIGEKFKSQSFSKEVMLWKIMKALPALLDEPGFEYIENYLNDKTSYDVKLYQISKKIASIFDQYQMYRQDMLSLWESNNSTETGDAKWQKILWNKIINLLPAEKTPNQTSTQFFSKIKNKGTQIKDQLPKRISVFGVTVLPPYSLQILKELSNIIDVNLFLLNPCMMFWSDIMTQKRIAKEVIRAQRHSVKEDRLHLEQGNSLLAFLGKTGMDFFDLVYDLNPEETALYEESPSDSLLNHIQNSILYLNADEAPAPIKIDDNDTSIVINSCHSPFREVEVLKDYLLDLFAKNPDLTPKDVIVMTPDIETYAPYIEAVFSKKEGDAKYFSYTIADRSYINEGALISAFFEILSLNFTRLEASVVFKLLGRDVILKNFDLNEDDLRIIKKWIIETNTNWGLDKDHKEKLQIPSNPENTWFYGIERMLSGYALTGNNFWGDFLPYDEIEGTQSLTLGKFIDFIKKIGFLIKNIAENRSLTKWTDFLKIIISSFFENVKQYESELKKIRDALSEITPSNLCSCYPEKIGFNSIYRYLLDKFTSENPGFGFLSGGVTFSQTLPMRSIPAKVICLMGMNNDNFPRRETTCEFDLIAQSPQKGDRSSNNNDKYLFLETIISAQNNLFISFIGRSIKDNHEISPSIVIAQLIDFIQNNFVLGNNKRVIDKIFNKHRLHSFSTAYFQKNSPLYSYSRESFNISLELQKKYKLETLHPVAISIKPVPPEFYKITIDDFISFFKNPSKYFLEKRLGLFLEKDDTALKDSENFEIQGLEKYSIANRVIKSTVKEDNIARLPEIFKAEGVLPPGNIGKIEIETLLNKTSTFAEKIKNIINVQPPKPIEISLALNNIKLTGIIDSIYEPGFIYHTFSKTRGKNLIEPWIKHLILNAVKPDCVKTETHILSVDNKSIDNCHLGKFFKIDAAGGLEHLNNLAEIYLKGLECPLPFFPDTSIAYVKEFKKTNSEYKAISSAKITWLGEHSTFSDSLDIYFNYVFKNLEPLNNDFKNIAITVFDPLISMGENLDI